MNLLTVKEYARIYVETIKNNFPGMTPGEAQDLFNQLEDFVKSFNNKNNFDGLDEFDNYDGFNFIDIRKDKKGDYVRFKQHVGLIEINKNFQIEVLPKFDLNDEKQEKRIFIKMLKSLFDIKEYLFPEASLDIARMNILDIYLYIYLKKIEKFIKDSLKRDYITKEDNLHILKGKLIVKKQITKNIIHAERFYVAYDDFNYDRPENKIIKSCLLKISRITDNIKNKALCRKLLEIMYEISPSSDYKKDYAGIVFTRNNYVYENIIRMSMIILDGYSYTSFSGKERITSLAFDMNKVFEKYVAKEIKKKFGSTYLVNTQHAKYSLFTKPNKSFTLKPDIVLTKNDNKKIIILDTKWKILNNSPKGNYGISQGDMYQMYAYSKKYQNKKKLAYSPDVWILYPKSLDCDNLYKEQQYDNLDIKNITTFTDYDASSNYDVKVRIFFIDLANIDTSLNNFYDLVEHS